MTVQFRPKVSDMYRLKPCHTLAIAACLVLAAEAVQADAPVPSHEPCAREAGGEACRAAARETARADRRYGIGYEARRPFDTGAHGDQGRRMDRPENSGRHGRRR